ncbi:MAG: hypothetical protein K6T61_10865 [Bryobacteraceae bacterium]|nr:hypothetical protein [Bryobacteraceae bacterium]
MRARCLGVGLLCAALAFTWQALAVRYIYGGNWTGLFCIGGLQRLPTELLGERLYTFPDSYGYDGQFYHYIAHDPLGRSRLPEYIDAPRMRYGRILIPAMAWLLAAGHPGWIDGAYFAVVLLFILMGGACAACFAERHGKSALWGLLFLLTPAALVSMDRMTIDISLAAICAAAAAFFPMRRRWGEWLLVAAAPLARETGLALTAAYLFWSVLRRDWRRVWGGALSVLPFAAWSLYLNARLGSMGFHSREAAPFRELAGVVLQPYAYPWSPAVNAVVIGADWLALAGALLAVVLAFRGSLGGLRSLLDSAILWFGLLGLALAAVGHRDIWIHLYGYGRVFSPLLLLLALRAVKEGTKVGFAPLLSTLLTCGLHFASNAYRILRGLIGP